jgi:predicted acyl esterase
VSPHTELWLCHQRRDDYWLQGSVSHRYGAVTCPVYAVGGWADAYTDGVFRLLEGLRVPRKGLVGPWAHAYPHEGMPGPAIGFLQEALRWWDQWLAGRDTGILAEPMLRLWMPESSPPDEARYVSPGRWVAEPSWPPAARASRGFWLAPGRLAAAPADVPARIAVRSPVETGTQAGAWCPFGPESMARDQGPDDERSVVFDSAPLAERLEILGAPVLRVRVTSDRPVATLIARLEDVFADGTSARVAYGVLELTHRESDAEPEPLPVDTHVDVELALRHAAHAFLPGHRLRLALSTAYWPVVWPGPAPATLVLHGERSSLELPVRTPRPEDGQLRPFQLPAQAPLPLSTDLSADVPTHEVGRDPGTGEHVRAFTAGFDASGEPALTRIEATGLEYGDAMALRLSIREGDPTSARAEMRHETAFRRPGWSVATRVAAVMTADERSFHLATEVEGREGGERVFHLRFAAEVPRDLR